MSPLEPLIWITEALSKYLFQTQPTLLVTINIGQHIGQFVITKLALPPITTVKSLSVTACNEGTLVAPDQWHVESNYVCHLHDNPLNGPGGETVVTVKATAGGTSTSTSTRPTQVPPMKGGLLPLLLVKMRFCLTFTQY